MWKSLSLSICLIAAIPTIGLGDWSIVSTFDSPNEIIKIKDVHYSYPFDGGSAVENGKWVVYPGTPSGITLYLFAILELGADLRAASIASEKPVTIYFEFTQPLVDNGAKKAVTNAYWGLIHEGPATVASTRYESYNSFQRINIANDTLEGRNGTSFVPHQVLQGGETYKIWFVLKFNSAPFPSFYDTYILGGQWTEQTLLSDPSPWAFFVNPLSTDKVEHFMVTTTIGTGKSEDPVYFDNVVIDLDDANLTVPDTSGQSSTHWAGYPIYDEFGNVDTGSWMGWVNVTYRPFIYSYELAKYLYIPDAALSEFGAWSFLY